MTFFSLLNAPKKRPSGEVAKRRLKNVLDAEHNGMSSRDMEALRRDLTRVLDSYFVLDDKPCRVLITRKRQKDGSYLRDVRIEVSARGVRRMAMHP